MAMKTALRPAPESAPSAPATRGGRRLSPPARKLVLCLHVVASVGLLGLSAAMLALGLAATGGDGEARGALYRAMEVLSGTVLPPAAVVALLSGVVLSLGTRWGLLKHRWIVVKLALTVAVILVGALVFGPAVERAAAGAPPAATLTVFGGANLLMLVVATAVSVYKPWGLTRRGRAASATGRRRD
ncbi:MAG: DUF2269 domain-containing protein [Actinomycetota bacterium]|nr:DUF2269 domain-containing protein [Actinomycetota bacterium]